MPKRRQALKLNEHEDRILKELYKRWLIPVDQYEQRREALIELTKRFNDESGRLDQAEDILHYMRTRRKSGNWVKLDGQHRAKPGTTPITAEQKEHLVEIYLDEVIAFDHGSDDIAYEPELLDLIAKEFAARTGRFVSGEDLNAHLTALRKRGLLPKVGRRSRSDGGDIGFSDIDEIVS